MNVLLAALQTANLALMWHIRDSGSGRRARSILQNRGSLSTAGYRTDSRRPKTAGNHRKGTETLDA